MLHYSMYISGQVLNPYIINSCNNATVYILLAGWHLYYVVWTNV